MYLPLNFVFNCDICSGEGPNPEEILTAIRVNGTMVALKSGFDKFLGVTSEGKVTGRSDAVGAREQWEPVFQDVRLRLCPILYHSFSDIHSFPSVCIRNVKFQGVDLMSF